MLQHQGTASLLHCHREPEEEDKLSPADTERYTREVSHQMFIHTYIYTYILLHTCIHTNTLHAVCFNFDFIFTYVQLLKALASPEGNKNPYMSPNLAPDDMLRGLPPVHIIVG